jgi:hypothetical protein
VTLPVPEPNQSATPPGTKQIVIFDTNAYRNFTIGLSLDDARAKALQLRQLEHGVGSFPLASPIVIWELIGHLGNISDPAYPYCLKALVALAEHTWSLHNTNDGICLFADPESTVCRELFHTVPSNAEQNVQNLSKLAAYVKQHAPNLKLPAAINNLQVFSAELAKRETEWLNDMQTVLNDCDPKLAKSWVGGKNDKEVRKKLRSFFGSQAFIDAWGAVTVTRHAEMVGAKLTPEELTEKAKVVQDVFPVPFHLMSALLQKFPTAKTINLNSSKKKWGNFMWDAAVCFSIGAFHELDGAPMFLVTSDRAIKDAATAAACANRVLSLSDYLQHVGLR